MKPTGKTEKYELIWGSDFSVFPVGFISILFHIQLPLGSQIVNDFLQ